MSTASLAGRQISFELRTFRRNRSAVLFTFFFPIMFLMVFSIGAGERTQSFRGGQLPFMQFLVPGILAYGVIGACYTNLAMRVVNLRESGVLKRVKSTPLPRLAYLAGHIGASVVVALVISMVTLVASALLFDVHIYRETLLAMLVTLAVGAACFCALGLAVASLVPNADGAPAIVNFTMFPILFISDIFFSVESGPSWLATVASFFPIKHFANALQMTFDIRTLGWGFDTTHLGVMLLWGIVSTVLAAKYFRWETRPAN